MRATFIPSSFHIPTVSNKLLRLQGEVVRSCWQRLGQLEHNTVDGERQRQVMEGRKDFPYVVALSCSCGLTVVVRRTAVFKLGVMPSVICDDLGAER